MGFGNLINAIQRQTSQLLTGITGQVASAISSATGPLTAQLNRIIPALGSAVVAGLEKAGITDALASGVRQILDLVPEEIQTAFDGAFPMLGDVASRLTELVASIGRLTSLDFTDLPGTLESLSKLDLKTALTSGGSGVWNFAMDDLVERANKFQGAPLKGLTLETTSSPGDIDTDLITKLLTVFSPALLPLFKILGVDDSDTDVKGEWAAVAQTAIGVSGVSSGVNAFLDPLAWTPLGYAAHEKTLRSLLSPRDYLDAYRRRLIKEETTRKSINERDIEQFQQDNPGARIVGKDPHKVGQWIVEVPIGPRARIRKFMHYQGWNDEHQRIMERLMEYFPTPGEIIRLAVRESLADVDPAKYTGKAAPPDEAIELAKKAGMSEDWFLKQWAAHWVTIPAPTAVDWYQRGIITRDQLAKYLVLADLNPTDQGYYLRAADSLIPRVDLRRAYDQGDLTYEQLVERYKMLGYRNGDEIIMANIAVSETMADERKLAEKEALAALKAGTATVDELAADLEPLGLPRSDIELMAARAEWEREIEHKELIADHVEARLAAEVITRGEAEVELVTNEFTAREIDMLIRRADTKRLKKIRRMTLTNVRDLYLEGAWSQEKVLERLKLMGMPEEDRNGTLLLWAIKKAKKSEE